MLNRKLSNYIFYIILIGIIAVVFLLRSVMLGGLIDKTEALNRNNIELQSQIDNLEDIVQTNKGVQESHLYELYNEVPQTYSQNELTYLVIAKLELAGIDESIDFFREISFNSEITFDADSALYQLATDFKIVEVQVTFDIIDDPGDPDDGVALVSAFIDLLNESEQLFLVDYVAFDTPNEEDFSMVTINFLAFYEK